MESTFHSDLWDVCMRCYRSSPSGLVLNPKSLVRMRGGECDSSDWDSGCQKGVWALPGVPEVTPEGLQETEKEECASLQMFRLRGSISGWLHFQLAVSILVQTIQKLFVTWFIWFGGCCFFCNQTKPVNWKHESASIFIVYMLRIGCTCIIYVYSLFI